MCSEQASNFKDQIGLQGKQSNSKLCNILTRYEDVACMIALLVHGDLPSQANKCGRTCADNCLGSNDTHTLIVQTTTRQAGQI